MSKVASGNQHADRNHRTRDRIAEARRLHGGIDHGPALKALRVAEENGDADQKDRRASGHDEAVLGKGEEARTPERIARDQR